MPAPQADQPRARPNPGPWWQDQVTGGERTRHRPGQGIEGWPAARSHTDARGCDDRSIPPEGVQGPATPTGGGLPTSAPGRYRVRRPSLRPNPERWAHACTAGRSARARPNPGPWWQDQVTGGERTRHRPGQDIQARPTAGVAAASGGRCRIVLHRPTRWPAPRRGRPDPARVRSAKDVLRCTYRCSDMARILRTVRQSMSRIDPTRGGSAFNLRALVLACP